MKMFKRACLFALAGLITASTLISCGNSGGGASTSAGGKASSAAAPSTSVADSSQANPDTPYAGTVLKYATTDTAATGPENLALVEMVKEMTGIEIEFTIIPTAADGEVDKTLVALQAGDAIDLIYGTTAGLKTFYNADVLEPIDQLAADAGYDFNSVYAAASLPTYNDGKTYGLPAFSDIWLTFINTKWFTEAGIEVPTADGWTWEKYIETAQAITDAGMTNADGQPVWGSFMETYNNYYYMLATQKGAQPYKADGTANFDDPLYTEAMEWYISLGNELGIQPDITNMKAGTYAWNQFVASDDMAMFVCGGWVASMLPDTEKYIRDWECAILPMPYPEGEQPSSLTIPGCYAIPVTSQNKEAAFEALRCIAENQYTLGYGRIPARQDLTDAEIMKYIETELLAKTFVNDAVTAEDIKVAWFDSNRTLLSEKIIGTADTVINSAIKAEGDLYGTGSQSLENTMQNIQDQANKAIEEELAAAA